jgi:hypothetical protein
VIAALVLAAIAFVPMDDRPVTALLPVMLGQIAGVPVVAPPRDDIGRFLQPGRSDALITWLNIAARERRARSFVISTDMLAYGGLVASRVPGPSYADAISRLHELAHLRAAYPGAWIGAFGTIMRLAPTGIPAGTPFFAAYPTWDYLQRYANLHDPPLPSEAASAAHLVQLMGEPALQAYLATRTRDLGVNRMLLALTANGAIDELVLGQDDAGPVGLHVPEVALLHALLDQANLRDKVSIEPGADELGMALVARAIARSARWTPRVAVRYSTAGGARYQDPIEYAPIATAIDALVGVCGGVVAGDDTTADIVLYVRVPGDTAQEDGALLDDLAAAESAGRSVALADLSYLQSYEQQTSFVQALLATPTAGKLDAYASWNTNANTVGTALAEAIAAGAGRRTHTYNDLAHRTFTFMRFVDDYAFHDVVRPQLNAALDAQGIADHTLLAPAVAAATAQQDRALLWNQAARILPLVDPGYHIAAIDIGLPWDRTFETSLRVAIAPNI